MWLVYQRGYPNGIPLNKNTAEATGIPEGTTVNFQPYIMFYTDSNTFVPWTASQTDLLGTDWTVVDDTVATSYFTNPTTNPNRNLQGPRPQ